VEEKTKKNLLNIAKVAGILIVIAVVSATILAVTNHFTYIAPRELFLQKLSGVYESAEGFADVLEGEEKPDGIDEAYIAKDGTKTMVLISRGDNAYKSQIKILIVITDYEIAKIEKYESNETPGLGANIFKEKEVAKYIGQNVAETDGFTTGTDANLTHIDGISGASKSSSAMANAVSRAAAFYKSYEGWTA
jgi:electron transport complex protein RnfG